MIRMEKIPGSDNYMLIDGEIEIRTCPCCTKSLTYKAATILRAKAEEFSLSLKQLVEFFHE